ncbi:MAG: endoglucanase [Jatrophihabitans sp.]
MFSQPGRVDALQNFESEIGAQLRVVHLYRTWEQPVGTPSDLTFAERGSFLIISWATPDLTKVLDGSQDALIAERATQIRALPTGVFLEIRWEMDRANLRSVVHNPATYIAAWKHIRAIFAANHVGNVAWTWCPTAGGFANGTAGAYYPGDDAVDWICADVYPTTPWIKGKYESFPSLAQAFMTWAAGHPNKPIMIGEFGVGTSYGADRARWITEACEYVMSHPGIKAVAWFDQTDPKDPVYYRFALTDASSLRAFSAIAQDPYFRPRVS